MAAYVGKLHDFWHLVAVPAHGTPSPKCFGNRGQSIFAQFRTFLLTTRREALRRDWDRGILTIMPINQFINTARQINVVLSGVDGSQHACGSIEGKILGEVHLLKHNDRYYHFSRVGGSNTAYFRECPQPYTVTEF